MHLKTQIGSRVDLCKGPQNRAVDRLKRCRRTTAIIAQLKSTTYWYTGMCTPWECSASKGKDPTRICSPLTTADRGSSTRLIGGRTHGRDSPGQAK
jgi:hypothetical protein